ncbi:MAG: hypothetical protein AAF840_07945 [Bacteroidota bacterium]
MQNFLTLLSFLALALLFNACGADGNLDPDRLKGYVDRFQEEVLPTKEEFREMAEKQIARLPLDEQAEAREALAETLANWPTDEDFDKLVDEAVEGMPTKAEWEEAMNQLSKEMPGGSKLREALDEALEQLPEGEELNKMVDESLDEMEKAVDETKKELKKQ